MKVLLTGSSGFIGSELKRVLLGQGHTVYCLNRKAKGDNQEIVWDFHSPLPDAMPKDVDGLIHLAAIASFKSEFDPELYQVNTVATSQLAAWAKTSGAFFIFASSIAVHSDATLVNHNSPVNPQSHYAISKYLAEQQIKAVLDRYVIARIGGVYGLDGPSHLGLNRAISKAFHQGEVPLLTGSGEMKRNYICVCDVALWLASLLTERAKSQAQDSRLVYIAAGEVLGLKDYLQATTRILTTAVAPSVKDGAGGSDLIVEADEPPMTLTTFEDYLRCLSLRRQELYDGKSSSLDKVECQG
jgi:nucleoside-diphosphate-sugar epimerase